MNAKLLNVHGSGTPTDFVTKISYAHESFLFLLPFPPQHIFSDILASGIVRKTLVSFGLSVGQCSSEAKDHFYGGFQCRINEAGLSRAGVAMLCYFSLQQE